MEIHKAIWMNRFLCFTKKKETLLLPSFLPQKKKQLFQKNGPNMVHKPTNSPTTETSMMPLANRNLGWLVVEHSPSHWKNMRRIVKLHENRNPKRSGWKFHQKILELPDTYAIALTLPVVKTKAVLDTAFEQPKRPNVSLSAWVQLMLPLFLFGVMTSMSKNLAGPISTRGPPPRILKTPTSATRNPWQLTLQILTLSSQFTSSEAQKEPQVMNFEGATNHGSKPHGPCHTGASPAKLSELSWRRFAPWMAEAEMDGRTLAWRIFFFNRSLYFVIWSFEFFFRCPPQAAAACRRISHETHHHVAHPSHLMILQISKSKGEPL